MECAVAASAICPKSSTGEELGLEGRIKGRIGCWHAKHWWMGTMAGKLRSDGGIEGAGCQLVKRLFKKWAY
ncbi:MAG: hypothetical protein FWG10_05295 [Eubacteriaceae bacterium]|nr:hypothetical protein [Eubacteriaceae bacterium]